MRINLNDADWSQYVAISFDMRVDGVSAGPCTDATREGCGTDGWASVSVFNMSGEWKWKEVSLGNVSTLTTLANHKIEFGDGEGKLAIVDITKMNAIGINLYGTQFTGDMYLDNMLLWKADGTADTLQNFNKSKPSLEGIASGELIQANTTGDWGASSVGDKTGICMPRVAKAMGLRLDVGQGFVAANFTAARSGVGSVMLLNSMGQVTAHQEFSAVKGMNRIELRNNYRGPAMLVVKQGDIRRQRIEFSLLFTM